MSEISSTIMLALLEELRRQSDIGWLSSAWIPGQHWVIIDGALDLIAIDRAMKVAEAQIREEARGGS